MAFEGLVIPHPRDFVSYSSWNTDGEWTVSRDIGDYSGYQSYKAFNNNSDRSLASGSAVNRLILHAPKVYLWAGCKIVVGYQQQCAGNISIEVSSNGGSTWNEVATGVIGNYDTERDFEFTAMSGNAICVHWTTASYGDVSEVVFYAGSQIIKFLIRDTDGSLKSYSGGSWSVIKASGDPTEADFGNSAITDANIASIPKSGYNQLGKGNIEVLMRALTGTNKSSKFSYYPVPKLIEMTEDIQLNGIDNIDFINLTSNVSGNGNLRIILSNDSGTTWYTWNGSFALIDKTNLNLIGTNGISPSTLNSMPSSEWNDFLFANRTFRVAFYFAVQSNTNVIEIDKLDMQMDLTGTWGEATPGTDYVVEWGNDVLKIKLKSAGSYKINHTNKIVVA